MKYFYDLHIHSDLSPCADKDMTPNNIANMAYVKGLNIIAITDHNSIENYLAVENVAEKLGILVIPGMEINTKEDVHVLSYFRDYDYAKKVSDIIYDSLPDILNKKEIFGEQNIYNEHDEVIGSIDKLLISASKYSISEIYNIVKKYHGIIIPAHVNKKSNGILGVLGFFPYDLDFNFIELSELPILNDRNKKVIDKYQRLINSDAHMLKDISEPLNTIELSKIEEVFDYLQIE